MNELFDSGVPRSESDLLSRWYIEAGRIIADRVLHPPGGTANAQAFNQARAAEQMRQIEKILAQLKVKSSRWIGTNFRTVAVDARKVADKQARQAGIKDRGEVVKGSFSLIDTRAVSILARDAYSDLSKAVTSIGKRADRVLRKTAQLGLDEAKINHILAGGLITGEPVETARKLREELKAIHGNTVQIIDKNDDPMEFGVGYYASLVARTKTREASVKARHERLQELDIDLVAIVGRISKNFCSAFLGQVFSLSGKSDKYPSYDSLPGRGPPFHPNCSKSTRPFVEELADKKQLDDAKILEPSLLGMNPTQAQRAFKDLQVHAQIEKRYAATEEKLFG